MSTTENTTAIVHPVTQEVIDLPNLATDHLARGLEDLGELLSELGAFRQRIVDEVARRMDTVNTRKERVGDLELETNAPTEEAYSVGVLRGELQALVKAEVLDQAVVGRLITTPAPKPPEERVDKREVNKLKRSDDPRVLAALARARTVNPQRRTLKVRRIPAGATPAMNQEQGPT